MGFNSPREIFNRLHQSVLNYDAKSQAELFDDNAVWEFPFAPDGIPKRIVGKDTIVAAAKAGMESSKRKGRRVIGYNSVKFYETTDQELIFVEFELQGEISSSGTKYQIPYIQLLKVRNGKIILLRDYFPGEILKMAFKK